MSVTWLLSFLLFDEQPQRFLGLTFGEVISLIVIMVGIAASYAKLSEEVRELKQGRLENKEAIATLRNDLNEHCDDDELHINNRIYQEFMRRFDNLDKKVDARNIRSGSLK